MYEDEFIDNGLPPIPGCWAAQIANDVDTSGDDLYVRIRAIDAGEKRWGPCRWAPQIDDDGDVIYPQEDNEALVVKDNEGEYWVLMWWQY